jgi:hypothetical protein
MKKKTLRLISYFVAIILFTSISACKVSKCTKCLVTPPPIDTAAIELVGINHSIDSAFAASWILRYKANKDSICNNMVSSFDSILNYSEAFNKEGILKLLCLKGCIGLRINYGMDSLFKVHQIITGVDQNYHDLYFKYKAGDPIPLGGSGTPGEKLGLEKGMPDSTHNP